MTPDQNRNQILTDYHSRLEDIHADKSISAEERRRKLAVAYVEALDRVAAVQSEEHTAADTTKKKLEDRYFKPARWSAWMGEAEKVGLATSLRDALGRAAATPDEELVALIERAERSGDDIQARAALQIAFERRNVDAINRFIEVTPSADADLNQLWELTQPPVMDGIADLKEAFRYAPPPPLSGLTERAARRLANGGGELEVAHGH